MYANDTLIINRDLFFTSCRHPDILEPVLPRRLLMFLGSCRFMTPLNRQLTASDQCKPH